MKKPALLVALCLVATSARAQTAPAAPTGPPSAAFAQAIDAYHAALLARHLGESELPREEISGRVARSEELVGLGRIDEAIALLAETVEHPQFAIYADSEAGLAAVFRLGDALARAGIDQPARGYLVRLVAGKKAWEGRATWGRRAVARLVDLALESGEFAAVSQDLAVVPDSAPDSVRGEIAYMQGRAAEAAGDPDRALGSYALVTQRCRFWAQATYLSGLIQVERGRWHDAEDLLCRVADPKRSAPTAAVFADERFFAVRDLARLGLGRIAHEQGRNDDARYYYYLVPRDSDRLAEALYESATTRYEKKDYEGASELLAELARLGDHHRYEDEAMVLGAWVDLARCRFVDADQKLLDFIARYEPVRDAARRTAESAAETRRLLGAVRSGSDAAGAALPGTNALVVRTVAALVRVDPAYDRVVRRREVLDRQASGLIHALAAIGDMQRALADRGGLRPSVDESADEGSRAREVRDALQGLSRQLGELEAAGASADRLGPLRQELASLEARAGSSTAPAAPAAGIEAPTRGADLPDLLRADALQGAALSARIAAARRDLDDAETALARDALHRLDLRLSRLLRRARLGRIESVLGRKRALETEIEAIRLGYLPQEAVDSLDAARYLEDNEEYWPFEGDDWPDEYVGSEVR